MDKFKAEIYIRLAAIEHVVQHIGRIAYLSAEISPKDVKPMHDIAREKLQNETFPGAPAVLSDHLAAEFAEHVDRLLAGLEDEVIDASKTMKPGRS